MPFDPIICRPHFDEFTASGLTERQRIAVVTDADVSLVVAGAGTGKTTTIVAKIDYLVRHGLAKPHEILVLAYNKRAQLELKSRIEDLPHGSQVRAVTFHAFGYGAVCRVANTAPTPLSESAPRTFMYREIDHIRRHEPLGSPLRRAMESFKVDFSNQEKLAGFVGNLLSFLNRYKTRRASVSALRRSARTQRQRDFLVLFEYLLAKYENHLRQSNSIDFSDMIVRATDLIESGQVGVPYRYILIDEFQDITQARWRLIQALQARNRLIKLFLVGDDWQFIYAFDDANVSIMTKLQSKELGVERIDLDTTFRFSQPLADLSSAFIMRNPAQLQKTITSANPTSPAQPLVIHRYDANSPTARSSVTNRLVRSIASERPGTTVLVLGRYNKTKPDEWNDLVRIARTGEIKLSYLTCHSAKGMEADEVIFLDVNNGTMGFPCRRPDDEFIQLLPTPTEPFARAGCSEVDFLAHSPDGSRIVPRSP